MDKRYKWSNFVIGVGLVLVLFSAPHLIDDFLFGIPEEFGRNISRSAHCVFCAGCAKA